MTPAWRWQLATVCPRARMDLIWVAIVRYGDINAEARPPGRKGGQPVYRGVRQACRLYINRYGGQLWAVERTLYRARRRGHMRPQTEDCWATLLGLSL